MIGITLGDANGVGPEIAIRAAIDGILGRDCILYGDAGVLRYASRRLDMQIDTVSYSNIDLLEKNAANGTQPQIRVIDEGILTADQVSPGSVNAHVGSAAVAYVKHASTDALAHRIDAVVTLPINKEASRIDNPDFSGHTDYIAELCGDPPVTMMLASEQLIVTHISTHVSVAEAVKMVTPERVAEVIRLTDTAVRRLRPSARIAVAGLNPHAGEGGAFGGEEKQSIEPAIEIARSEGIEVYGPEPGDTVFHNAIRNKRFDAVVCMYHDQGHIAMKTLDFDGAVNITLGLPIVRTSVDHGTAYDIAYQGRARSRSFELALGMARKLIRPISEVSA